jgi:hypothetical protein
MKAKRRLREEAQVDNSVVEISRSDLSLRSVVQICRSALSFKDWHLPVACLREPERADLFLPDA